ncbi:preprotein translocase subunit SecE [Schaalia vaccimaxillae]|uniref:preprotein translocase subunit SecE n=1 Tax=Schaalia vaccimaxillae TaxID=183916 RepID=UPI0003B44FCA|nr:preprotein translocase subunit SecE [Schaalia vaccimaxillae]
MSDTTVTGGDSVRRDRSKQGATPSRDRRVEESEKKPNIFKRIWIFITQVIAEMKKVTYPTGQETWTYFTVVIVFVVAIMAFAGLLDFGFGKLASLIFG